MRTQRPRGRHEQQAQRLVQLAVAQSEHEAHIIWLPRPSLRSAREHRRDLVLLRSLQNVLQPRWAYGKGSRGGIIAYKEALPRVRAGERREVGRRREIGGVESCAVVGKRALS